MITTQAQIDLVNQAFRSLGEKPIALPADETNPRWLLAEQFYDQTQDELLTAHFWNFATVRAVLAPAPGVTPAYGWAHAFALPPDYLAMQRVQLYSAYQREGAYFLSDDATLPLTYTTRLTDVTLWPAFFTHAFVAHLTAAFAEQVTGQIQKAQFWLQLADKRLARAKAHDSQEGTPPILQSNDLILARRGAWRFGGR